MRQKDVQLQTTITCPTCGHAEDEIMPQDACICFYDCRECRAVLRPKPGDCCVFCSWATVPCPPVQQTGAGGGHAPPAGTRSSAD